MRAHLLIRFITIYSSNKIVNQFLEHIVELFIQEANSYNCHHQIFVKLLIASKNVLRIFVAFTNQYFNNTDTYLPHKELIL